MEASGCAITHNTYPKSLGLKVYGCKPACAGMMVFIATEADVSVTVQ